MPPVQVGSATFYGRIVEAQFPNWHQLVPDQHQGVTVNAAELRGVIAAFPKDRDDRVRT